MEGLAGEDKQIRREDSGTRCPMQNVNEKGRARKLPIHTNGKTFIKGQSCQRLSSKAV